MSSVTLANVRKSYDGDVHVIKGIDLEIQNGEFLVLVGPSGCGKSTLLRMVAGLEDITSGDMMIGDARVNDVAPRDRGVAMVFQSYALYPHMTVRENMAFGLKIRKEPQSEIDTRVNEVAKLLDIEPLLERLPKAMSGGQRQRVAIGRAIVRKPDVFLFDEPLSNLDAALRTQMRVELKKLHARLETTMIYVTHDQVEAMTLANRIAVLNAGHLQQAGSPEELYDRPANRFVAGFIGSPSMNFLSAARDDDGFATAIGNVPCPPWASEATEIGVRPHHLSLVPVDGESVIVNARLDIVEPMGWEAHLHMVASDESPITAHAEVEQLGSLERGQDVPLYLDVGRIHYFAANGDALRDA